MRGKAIAIVGIGCRFPGAGSPAAYWDLLCSGDDAVGAPPPGRWDVPSWQREVPNFVAAGGYIDGIDQFDPKFFAISPREAAAIDPQQRLLLEVGWEALENAGLRPSALGGSDVGVYIGIGASEYDIRFQTGPSAATDALYSGIGNDSSFAAGRMANLLGLGGPALSVNTACSSALVALHLATQALRRGECRAALVGAANLLVVAENTARLTKMGVLSPDGRCKTFDRAGDGYGRGEGAGAVVLMPVDDALEQGCRVLAIIRGSAVNQDGPDADLLAPSQQAQERLIAAACHNAEITPADLDYIEAHGSGTPTGDPVELAALASVIAGRERPLLLGSAKTRVAHLEVAAGMAGLIKTVLALVHQAIPPHPVRGTAMTLTPTLELPTEVVPWRRGERPRLAGVSAFGLSGTNAHVILSEGPPSLAITAEASARLVVLSAVADRPLRSLAAAFADRLRGGESLADVSFTAAVGREHHRHRLAVLASTAEEAAERLQGLGEGRAGVGQFSDFAAKIPQVAFLFPGEGPQPDTRAVRRSWPAFNRAMDRCEAIATLEGDAARVAMGWSLAQLWASWGVAPTAVVGQGIGEVTACAVAGVFGIEDALRFAVERGRLTRAPREDSGMDDVMASLAQAVNARGEGGPRIVSHAQQSSLTGPQLDALGQLASKIEHRLPRVPVYSSMSGGLVESFDAAYWRRHAAEGGPGKDPIEALKAAAIEKVIDFGASTAILAALAELYVAGVDIDWDGHHEAGGARLDLPTYPFERRRCWIEVAREEAVPVGGETVAAPSRWFSGVEWVPIPPLEPADSDGTWLVLADQTGIGEALRAGLGDCVVVDRDSVTDLGQTLEDLEPKLGSLRGIVYLWGLDQPAEMDFDDLVAGVGGALQLSQALLKHRQAISKDCALWLVSRGGVQAGSERVDAAQTPLWGLGRSIVLEHPELRVRNVDLEAGGSARPLLALLQGRTDEDMIALRGASALAARLSKRPLAPAFVPADPRGVYLVTGGLGALGLRFASWLAERGARHLVLCGRSAPGPDAQAVVDALRAQGVEVDVASLDVADHAAVEALIARIAAKRPLKGILHAAGVLDEGVLVRQNPVRLRAVMSPKVLGTWNLHLCTRSQPLDWFVLCSSIASVFGSPGQSGYAAANAFLDGAAAQLGAEGVPAVSINWGPWAATGMTAAHSKRSADRGMPPLNPDDAMFALEQAVASGLSQIGVFDLDLERVGELGPRVRDRPFIRHLWVREETGTILEQLSRGDRAQVLNVWLAQQVARTLGMDAFEADPSLPLTDHGLDSLMALELKEDIDDALGIDLPPDILQSGASLETLAERLLADVVVPAVPTFGDLPVLAASEPAEPGEVSSNRPLTPAALAIAAAILFAMGMLAAWLLGS